MNFPVKGEGDIGAVTKCVTEGMGWNKMRDRKGGGIQFRLQQSANGVSGSVGSQQSAGEVRGYIPYFAHFREIRVRVFCYWKIKLLISVTINIVFRGHQQCKYLLL